MGASNSFTESSGHLVLVGPPVNAEGPVMIHCAYRATPIGVTSGSAIWIRVVPFAAGSLPGLGRPVESGRSVHAALPPYAEANG